MLLVQFRKFATWILFSKIIFFVFSFDILKLFLEKFAKWIFFSNRNNFLIVFGILSTFGNIFGTIRKINFFQAIFFLVFNILSTFGNIFGTVREINFFQAFFFSFSIFQAPLVIFLGQLAKLLFPTNSFLPFDILNNFGNIFGTIRKISFFQPFFSWFSIF